MAISCPACTKFLRSEQHYNSHIRNNRCNGSTTLPSVSIANQDINASPVVMTEIDNDVNMVDSSETVSIADNEEISISASGIDDNEEINTSASGIADDESASGQFFFIKKKLI